LQRVEIVRGDDVLYRRDLKDVQAQNGQFVYREEVPVNLVNGPNQLELMAVNDDGRSPQQTLVVSYVAPAVVIMIDEVEMQLEDGKRLRLKPECKPDCTVSFKDSPKGLVHLIGRIRWSDPAAKDLDDESLQVVTKVEDVRQFPVALGPRGKGADADTRPFRIPLALIGRNNHVRVEVPSVPQQERSGGEFELACTAPVLKQRLHLLIVGVDVKDGEALKRRVFDAIVVESKDQPPGSQGEFFKKPPFDQCVLHGVLAGEVDKSSFGARLLEINEEIRNLERRTGWINDVIFIYYQGKDLQDKDDKDQRWLLTSRNLQFPAEPPQTFAIPLLGMPKLPGTEIVCLNVVGPAKSLPQDLGVGVFRYASTSPADTETSDPAFLRLLRQAVSTKGKFGDIVSFLNTEVGKQPTQFSPLVDALDPLQRSRRLHEPAGE
jgi:hypothetical protein